MEVDEEGRVELLVIERDNCFELRLEELLVRGLGTQESLARRPIITGFRLESLELPPFIRSRYLREVLPLLWRARGEELGEVFAGFEGDNGGDDVDDSIDEDEAIGALLGCLTSPRGTFDNGCTYLYFFVRFKRRNSFLYNLAPR